MSASPYYYVNTLASLTMILERNTAAKHPQAKPTLSHMAWMVKEITTFDRHSMADALKAARWIGWLLCAAEMHGFWDNNRSRALIRMDKEAHTDLPSFDGTV